MTSPQLKTKIHIYCRLIAMRMVCNPLIVIIIIIINISILTVCSQSSMNSQRWLSPASFPSPLSSIIVMMVFTMAFL